MTLNWGIIGMGDIADRVTAPAMNLAENNRLVAVMRRDTKKAKELAEKHGAARHYGSVEGILSDEEINAVYVATPVHLHLRQTMQAAEKGKHVLCEKPMALNAAESRKMVDACERAGVTLMICYYQRFNRRHQKIRELVASGAIGQVTAVRINFSGLSPENPDAWRQNSELGGGGNLMDCGSHCVDLLRYLLGEVTQVSALVDTLVFSYQVDDTATLLLKMANGAHAVVTSHWSTLIPGEGETSSLAIYGDKGTILSYPLHDKFSRGELTLATETERTVYRYEKSTHVALLEAFASSVEENRPAPITGYDGLRVSEIIEAAYESANTGGAIATAAQ